MLISRRLVLGGALLAAMSPAVAACSGGDVTTFRYRLTVEVDTPEGLRTGSSVIEVRVEQFGPNSIPAPYATTVRAKGEAVAVDLPGGKTVYALLSAKDFPGWAGWIMIEMTPPTESGRVAPRLEAMLTNKSLIEVPEFYPQPNRRNPPPLTEARPLFVTFADPADSRTVEIVEPEHFGEAFGEGISLKRVTVQLTEDEVTTGILDRLPWLREPRHALLVPGPDSNTLADHPAATLNIHALFREY